MAPKGAAWNDNEDRKFLLGIISTNKVAPNWKAMCELFPERTMESLKSVQVFLYTLLPRKNPLTRLVRKMPIQTSEETCERRRRWRDEELAWR